MLAKKPLSKVYILTMKELLAKVMYMEDWFGKASFGTSRNNELQVWANKKPIRYLLNNCQKEIWKKGISWQVTLKIYKH